MSGLYIISGDDEFERKRRARELASGLARGELEGNDGVEIIPGDSSELKPDAIGELFLEALRTPPFLSDFKLIWMRHHPDLGLICTGKGPVETEIAAVLKQPLPPDIVVVIDGPGFDGRSSFAKTVKAAGAMVENFNRVKGKDRNFAENRRSVISSFCRNSGKRLAPDAVQYLTDVIGSDSGMLENELEKLCCYAGDAPDITLADCHAVVSRTPEALNWEYTEAVCAGNAPQALHLLGILLQDEDTGASLRLMASLSNEFQGMIQTRMAMKQLNLNRVTPRTFDGIPEEVRAKNPENPLLKLHPYRAFKICERAAGFSGAALAEKLTAIRNASRALVSGGGNMRIVWEQLTLRLTARK